MAHAASPTTGTKRGPGRPPKDSQPALKKTRLSTSIQPSPPSSSIQSPTTEAPHSNKLPYSISASRPLPALPQPQSPSLSDADYQSIAASAVLQTSLDRSRIAWVHDGVLERYWTKPESGKNARPPPANNPELKWQKHKGPCRLRIEPHIFEAEMYLEEKPKPVVKQPTQYGAPVGGVYGPGYRPGQQAHGQQQQGRYYGQTNLPPVQQPVVHPGNTLPRSTQSPQPPLAGATESPSAASPTPGQSDKKPSPDPVISMLATRASSDPELKSLMKEVATGNATQEQLKIFQGHIDSLTKIINDRKKKDEEAEAAAQAAKQRQQQSEAIKYDGAAENKPYQPPSQQIQPYQYQAPAYQQQTWQPAPRPPPAPPQPQPVILAFTSPGATEDRFLFPQNSILEPLSPQHLLASFIITRRGAQAADSTGLEPGKEYWQPVTCMVEVAYNREHLLECVKKWVKPAEEVRKAMEEVMKRCERAPDSILALRLPKKGTEMAGEPEEVLGNLGEEVVREMEREKERKTVKYVKKDKKAKDEKDKAKSEAVSAIPAGAAKDGVPATVGSVSSIVAADGKPAEGKPVGASDKPTGTDTANAADQSAGAEEKKEAEPETTESGRPRRTVRKSVRISGVA